MKVGDLKVGDRIRLIKDYENIGKGKIARLISLDNYKCSFEFEDNIGGHSCGGMAKDDFGWNISYSFTEFELLESLKDEYKIAGVDIPSEAAEPRENQVGDTVKLKEYGPYGDYASHKDQEAKIEELLDSLKEAFELRIKWADLKYSHVYKNNIINLTIEEEIKTNKIVKKEVKPQKMTEDNKGLTPTMGKMLQQVVMPVADKKAILEAIISAESQAIHDKIFVEWGFGEVIEKGKGCVLMFFGPPGTGKTMCAQAISEHLGRKHMTLGTAELQSNVPGQMERNIKNAFAKAKSDKLVIIFDECDSLLYNRANVGVIIGAEINCLLSEIEKFEGVCIMTTNRNILLDPALERRISLKMEFKNPDAKMRKFIWQKLIPEKCPLGKCVDFNALSEEYDIPGGNIKNAVLTAARSAAYAEEKHIKMEHFVSALEKEISGMGAFKKEIKNEINIAELFTQDKSEGNISRKTLIEKIKDISGGGNGKIK